MAPPYTCCETKDDLLKYQVKAKINFDKPH